MTYEIAGRLVWACHSDWCGFFVFSGGKFCSLPRKQLLPRQGNVVARYFKFRMKPIKIGKKAVCVNFYC